MKTVFSSWLLLVVGGTTLFFFSEMWKPWQKLAAMTLGLLYLLKMTVFLHKRRENKIRCLSPTGFILFFTVWPGINPDPFYARSRGGLSDAKFLGYGLFYMLVGMFLILLLVVQEPRITSPWMGWLGIAALLFTIHLGYSDVLTACIRCAGWNVGLLFHQPFRSRSLADFWGHRWNLAFVEMNHILFWKPLLHRFGPTTAFFGIFMISGFLHELAVSYPAGGGWGMPMAYFTLHGILTLAESKFLKVDRWPQSLARLWTWFWVITPLPLLFHIPFQNSLIIPLYHSLHHCLFYELH